MFVVTSSWCGDGCDLYNAALKYKMVLYWISEAVGALSKSCVVRICQGGCVRRFLLVCEADCALVGYKVLRRLLTCQSGNA